MRPIQSVEKHVDKYYELLYVEKHVDNIPSTHFVVLMFKSINMENPKLKNKIITMQESSINQITL